MFSIKSLFPPLSLQKTLSFTFNKPKFFTFNSKMYQIDENSQQGEVVQIKNDIIRFTNFSKSLMNTQSVIQTLSGDLQGLVLTLNDQISTALALQNYQFDEKTQQLSVKLTNVTGIQVQISSSKALGQIIDYSGNNLVIEQPKSEESDIKYNIFQLKTGYVQSRVTSQYQIYTGNISIDMTNSISQGNFVLLKGKINTGKSYLAGQLLKQNLLLNKNTFCVFVTHSMNTAKAIQEQLKGFSENFIIFSCKEEEHSLSKRYLSGFSASVFAKKLQQEQGKDVIVVYDNIQEHFECEKTINNNSNGGSRSLIKEIFSMSGNFGSGNGSFSSIVIFDSENLEKELSECESYADKIINFDLNEPYLRNIKPKIQLKGLQNVHCKQWMNDLYRDMCIRLNQVLVEVNLQQKEAEKKEELKIFIEPWDYYLLNDSKYFMKILVSNNYYSPVEQIVIVGVILECIEEETIAQFKETPEQLLQSLISFTKEFKEYENKNIFEYIEGQFSISNNETGNQYIEFIKHSIRRLYLLFIMHQKINDRLLAFKKDYFN